MYFSNLESSEFTLDYDNGNYIFNMCLRFNVHTKISMISNLLRKIIIFMFRVYLECFGSRGSVVIFMKVIEFKCTND